MLVKSGAHVVACHTLNGMDETKRGVMRAYSSAVRQSGL
jgi:hypothetical protein